MPQADQTAVRDRAVPGSRRRGGQPLRNLELGLLVFAAAIDFAALLLVQFGVTGAFDFNVVTLTAVIFALTIAMHVVLRFRAPDADPFLLPIASVLNGLGIALIYRIDLANETNVSGSQMVLTAISVAIAVVVLLFLRNHRVLQRFTYIAMAASIVLLLLPFVPGLSASGEEGVNAYEWIRIGPATFQPGEIAKITIAVFFAGYLVTARDSLSVVGKKLLWMRFPRIRDLGPILIVWLVCMGVLVLAKGLGASLLYFGLFLVMIYVATGRGSWILIGVGLFAAGAVFAATTIDYVHYRMLGWLDPFNPEIYEATGGSYQLVQGIFGMASGGLIGQGLGGGRPDITPLASSDFIVATLGEELGLAGVFAVLCLFIIFVARGLRVGYQGLDDFGRLLATGLSFIVALQVFIIMGGVMRVIPMTGLAMPFMASGGSSLVANWIIVAVLLRLSDTVRREPEGVPA